MNPIRKFATGGLAALMMTVGTAALAPSPALAPSASAWRVTSASSRRHSAS